MQEQPKEPMTLSDKKAKVYDLSSTLERMKQQFQMQAQPLIQAIKDLESEIKAEEMKKIKENQQKQEDLAKMASKKKK